MSNKFTIQSRDDINASDLQRFFDRIDKSPGFGPKKDCWIWRAPLVGGGYGQFVVTKANLKKYINAHRLSYIIYFEQIPYGMYVFHKCDNPSCVNPDHLFLGTQKDNRIDCIKKGRSIRKIRIGLAKVIYEKRKELGLSVTEKLFRKIEIQKRPSISNWDIEMAEIILGISLESYKK